MSRVRLTKIAAPSNPPASTAELYYDTTDSKLEAIDASGNRLRLGGFATSDYRLVQIVHIYLTATGYTPSAGVRALFVQALGAGGQGGGALNGATNAAGGGGGAGAYAEDWITAGVAGHGAYTIQVGVGGSGAAAGNTAGNNGTSTFFDTNVVTANGGTGGAGMANVAVPNIGAAGGLGGAASNQPNGVQSGFALAGAAGDRGVIQAAGTAFSGKGADSIWGGGGISAVADGTGNNAVGYGGGGSGGLVLSSGAVARAGGTGFAGLLVIWEYA